MGTQARALLRAVRDGQGAGVIFFAGNISSPAQLAAVARRLQRAGRKHNPVRAPLLLMADQEGGAVRRLPGPPDLSERQIGQYGRSCSSEPAPPGGAVSPGRAGRAAAAARFRGVTITDALEAGALRRYGTIERRGERAALAGMDLLPELGGGPLRQSRGGP